MQYDQERMRDLACLMLVEIASQGHPIEHTSKALIQFFKHGPEDAFVEVCRGIGEMCELLVEKENDQ